MRYMLQRPLQDELWSSMLIRSVRRAGVSINMAMQSLGVGKAAPSFFSIRHLEVAYWLSMSEVQALGEHTVLPYVIAFLGQDERTRMTEIALSPSPSEALKAAVARGVVDYVRYRRFCPACARHEWLTMETSFWHLSHNLPGVTVCTDHQLSLIETTTTTLGKSRWFYELPHEASGRRLLPGRPSIFDMELARRSITLLGPRTTPKLPRLSTLKFPRPGHRAVTA